MTPEGEVSRLRGFKSIYETLAEKLAQRGVSLERCAVRAKAAVLRERASADCRAVLATLAAELEKRTGRKPALVAEGRFATVAACVRAAAPDAFASIRLVNAPKSYQESLRARDYLSFADLCH